jgi:hypothetical protein
MICPKCKAEYVQGITVCADCDVPLVDELPEKAKGDEIRKSAHKEIGFAEVFITLNAAEIIVVKSILDGAGIEYYIKSEHFTLGRPFEDPARLHIRVDQLDEAMDILGDFGVWEDLNEDEEEQE